MKYALFAAVSTAFVLLAWVLAPLLAGLSMLLRLIAPFLDWFKIHVNTARLPFGLQWFSTVDDDLDGGQHQNHYPRGATGWRLWWQRTRWIYRNPAQGFQAYLLGYSATNHYLAVDRVTANGGRYREWRGLRPRVVYARQVNVRLTDRYYIKMWFGWALKANMNRFTLKFVPFSIGVTK